MKIKFALPILLLSIATNLFAGSPLKGIDVKLGKSPGGGCSARLTSGDDGNFSTQLPEGDYWIRLDQAQIKDIVNEIVKNKYPKSSYQFDGGGIEISFDQSSHIQTTNQRKHGSVVHADFNREGEIIIVVPKGGATLSCVLNWNDDFMNESSNSNSSYTGLDKTISGTHDRGMSVALNMNDGSSSSSGVSSNFNINPNASVEWIWNGIGVGLDAGFFSSQPNLNLTKYIAPFKEYGFADISNIKSKWSSFYIMAGPQYSFMLGKKTELTFYIKGGFTLNKPPNFTVTDTGASKTLIVSYKDPEDMTTRNAFTVKPGVVFSYWFSEHWGFGINAQYLLQTGQSEFATGYRDLSKVDFATQPDKLRQEILNAPKVIVNTKGADIFISAGIGIKYIFKSERQKSHSNSTRTGNANDLEKNDVEPLPLDAAKVKSHSNQTNNRIANTDNASSVIDSSKHLDPLEAAKVKSHSNQTNNRIANTDNASSVIDSSKHLDPLDAAKVKSHSNHTNNRSANANNASSVVDSSKHLDPLDAAKVKSHSNQTNNRSANTNNASSVSDSSKHLDPLDAAKVKSHSNQTNNRSANANNASSVIDSSKHLDPLDAAKVKSHSNQTNNRSANTHNASSVSDSSKHLTQFKPTTLKKSSDSTSKQD